MFIELHVIQNFAPSNLNRDDTGNPKDCEFGGVRRARISSQCFKRAIRQAPIFAQTTGVELGERSRWVTRRLRQALAPAGKTDIEIHNVLDSFIPEYLSKFDTKYKPTDEESPDKLRTAVLIYFGRDEIQTMTRALLENWPALLMQDKKVLRTIVRTLVKQHHAVTSTPDIALFGRMLAEKPILGLEAACQVAHAISTHRVTMEMDFYTAVDDLLQNKEKDDENTDSGAAMMGFTGFDSACFYRYVRIDWQQLLKNLAGDIGLARRTVHAFMLALVQAVPTGKQNAFAAHNPPSFMLAAVRQGNFAWSLSNAFERPIARRGGLVAPSVTALDTYWERLTTVYGTHSLLAHTALLLDPELTLNSLTDVVAPNLDTWITTVLQALPPAEA